MANGNLAAGFAASTGPVVRAEYSCHSFPEATRHGPPRRTPPGQVRGREPQTAPGTGQPPDDDRIGEITGAGRRIWRGATAGDGVMITRWLCGQPPRVPDLFSSPDRNSGASWLELAGQGKRAARYPYFRNVVNSRMSRMRATTLQPS